MDKLLTSKSKRGAATVVILFISKEVLSEGANKSGKVPEEIQTAKTSPEKKQQRNGP